MLDRSKVILRSLDSFGIAGQLSPEGEVFYTALFGTKHLGRVTDLLCARLEKSGVDELRLRCSVLLSVFEACHGLAAEEELKGAVSFSAPLSLECGIDEEKVAIGISFALNPSISLNTEGLADRVSKGSVNGKLEGILKELRTHSDLLFVKHDPIARKVEVVALIGLASQSDSKTQVQSPLEILTLDSKTSGNTPKPRFYSDLGDLDYSTLLKGEGRPNEVTGHSGEIVAPKARSEKSGKVARIAGESSADGATQAEVEGDAEASGDSGGVAQSGGKTLAERIFGKKKKPPKKAQPNLRASKPSGDPAVGTSGSDDSDTSSDEELENPTDGGSFQDSEEARDEARDEGGDEFQDEAQNDNGDEAQDEGEEKSSSFGGKLGSFFGLGKKKKKAAPGLKKNRKKQQREQGLETLLQGDEAEDASRATVEGTPESGQEDRTVTSAQGEREKEARLKGTKAQNESGVEVKGSRESLLERVRVKDGEPESEEETRVKGQREKQDEHRTVRGGVGEKDEETRVRGHQERIGERILVKGKAEAQEAKTRIRGKADQLGDEEVLVRGQGQEEGDDSPLLVKGKKEKKSSLWRVRAPEGEEESTKESGEESEEEAPLPKPASGSLLKRAGRVIRNLIGIFGRGSEENEDTSVEVKAKVDAKPPVVAPTAVPSLPESALAPSAVEPGSLESDAKKLMHELHGGGLDQVLRVAQWEALAVKRDIKNPKASKWVDNLMGSLVTERSRLAELGKKIHLSVRLKEMEFKDKASLLQEEVRKRDAIIAQRTAALSRAKDQLSKVSESNEKLKVIAQNSEEDIHYKQKYDMTAKMLELAKEENAKIIQRSEELKAQLATNVANSKSSPATVSQMAVLQGKYEKLFKQSEEFKKANRQLMERLNEPRRAAAGTEEIRKKIEMAMKLVNQEKQEKQVLKGHLVTINQEQNRLREEIKKLQLENKHLLLAAQQTKKPPGGTSTPPRAA